MRHTLFVNTRGFLYFFLKMRNIFVRHTSVTTSTAIRMSSSVANSRKMHATSVSLHPDAVLPRIQRR